MTSDMDVDDLEHNSKPAKVPRSTVLGAAMNGIIGVLVCHQSTIDARPD